MIRALAFALLLCPAAAHAQSNFPQASTAKSESALESLESPAQALPWQAVGRLDMGNGFCTGALISPSLVLTAAHCVYDKGDIRDPATITFQAGYRHGRSVAVRQGKRLVTHIDYVDDGLVTSTMETIATDVAVIELTSPIVNAAVIPFERHREPPLDARVVVVSYARGRAEVPSMEEGCKLFGRQNTVMQYNCDLDYGASGSPVFTITTAGPKIAAIMSATAELGAEKIALGVPLGAAVDRMVRSLQTTNNDARFVKTNARGGAFQSRTVTGRSGLPQITR